MAHHLTVWIVYIKRVEGGPTLKKKKKLSSEVRLLLKIRVVVAWNERKFTLPEHIDRNEDSGCPESLLKTYMGLIRRTWYNVHCINHNVFFCMNSGWQYDPFGM